MKKLRKIENTFKSVLILKRINGQKKALNIQKRAPPQIRNCSGVHSFFFSKIRRHLVQYFNSLFLDVVYIFIQDVVHDKTNNYLALA